MRVFPVLAVLACLLPVVAYAQVAAPGEAFEFQDTSDPTPTPTPEEVDEPDAPEESEEPDETPEPGPGEASPPEEPSRANSPNIKGGIFDKPYITRLWGRTAVGGYAEVHFRYVRADGFVEEVSVVPERLNLFTFTPVMERIRVATELEIEEGGEEIKLELAIIDFQIHPLATLRGGVILSPLGRFNLAHDSPANDLTDRPLVSTELLGTTLSEAGLGVYGYAFPSALMRFTYEAYIVNGFTAGVIEDDPAGTRIAAGRANFEDNNNHPSIVGRVAFSPHPIFELGVAAHNGPYNVFELEGEEVQIRRDVTILAVDADVRWQDYELKGEYARVSVQLPGALIGILSRSQQGLYLQANAHFLRGKVVNLPESVFTGVLRYDFVDFDTDIDGDSLSRITAGVNFRPVEDTVFKLDYQYSIESDRANLPVPAAALLFSVATYF